MTTKTALGSSVGSGRATTSPPRGVVRPGASGRGPWPYARPGTDPASLPATLPGGRPWPRISIVTPSFNQGQYIEQTILSVLNQGYPDVEHIVMDGGSTDQTRAVLDRYADRLARVVSEKDRGQSDAINKGMSQTTGEIVTWLNSDDLLAPGALAAAALAFHVSGADMVAGVCQLHRDGRMIEQHVTTCPDGELLPLDELLDLDHRWMAGQFFYQPEVLFTRDLWDRAGGRVDESLYYSMDYELWLRFAQHRARLHVIGRPIAQYRVHPDQKTFTSDRFKSELIHTRDAFLRRTGTRWAGPSAPSVPAKNALRIAFLNDHGFKYGAGLAHGRLAAAAASGGHQVIPIALANDHGHAAPPATTDAILDHIRAANPDLVVAGNVHGVAPDGLVLDAVCRNFPTAFVLHDCWMMTGRCAYVGACGKHRTAAGCDHECPTWQQYPSLEPQRVPDAWQFKQHLLRSDHAPALLGDSQWMLGFVRQTLAAVAGPNPRRPHAARAAAVRYGFPLDVFRPHDKQACRNVLGLPDDRFLVLFSASAVHDPRKGVGHLVEALRHLNLPDVTAVCVGYYGDQERPDLPDLRIMGYMDDPLRLAMLYSAVDLFVGPSLEEAFGQVFVEAAACGTPSVGYPAGGVPEAITDGVTGRVASHVAPAALADAIRELYLDPALRRDMGAWGRLLVENEWSMATALQRLHVALRETGLADRTGLARKITMPPVAPDVPAPTAVRPEWPLWRAVSGFAPWEGPYPQWHLPRVRSARGPIGRIELDSDAEGPHEVMIRCFNTHPGQRLAVYRDGAPVGETRVPQTSGGVAYVATFPVDLRRGTNVLELRYWQWQEAAHSSRALLVADILCRKIK